MDRVHGVVHGPGPQGWSMDPGPCFVYVLQHYASTVRGGES